MLFWVAFGGALGSVLRFSLGDFITEIFGESFPWGTLFVNGTGCFAIGIFAALTDTNGYWPLRPEIRQFFMAGIFGGYTTFSTFSLQTLNLAKNGAWLSAGFNSVGSLILCLLAVWLGHTCAVYLNSMKA